MGKIGATHFHDAYLEDIHISEKEKASEWYLKDNIDYWIANLVREKTDIKTMRDYYHGVRDQREFEYLTENFGIGSPSKLKFTPLIKPRIDSLLGKMVDTAYTCKVTCLDDKTIATMEQEKKNEKLKNIEQALEKFIQINMEASSQPQANPQQQQMQGQGQGPAMSGTDLGKTLEKIQSKFGTNYLSDFEIAAQDLLRFFKEDVHIDLKQKLNQMALDLLVTGQC